MQSLRMMMHHTQRTLRMTMAQHTQSRRRRRQSNAKAQRSGAQRATDCCRLNRHRHHSCRRHRRYRIMRSIVCTQTDRCRKHFVALTTLIRFVAPVVQVDFSLVRHHITISRESLAARITVMILDASVCDHVAGHIARRYETLVTDRTHLITYARMDFLVRLEIAERRKLFAAYFTLKRTFAGMRSCVYGQIVFLGKSTRTIGTDKRSLTGMRANVQTQLGRTFERFIAIVARLGDFGRWFGAAFLAFFGQFPFVAVACFAVCVRTKVIHILCETGNGGIFVLTFCRLFSCHRRALLFLRSESLYWFRCLASCIDNAFIRIIR